MINKYSINTTQNVDIDLEIAGMGDRLIALLIDYLILGVIGFFMMLLFSAFRPGEHILAIVAAVYGFFTFLYHFIMELAMRGQTIGKQARDIRVVHKSGREAGVFHYLIRNLIRPLDLFYGLGALVMFFNGRTQRIGDMAAGTLVVKLGKRSDLNDTVLTDLEEDFEPVFERLHVLRLDNQDIELIKEVTNRNDYQMNWELVRLTAGKIKEKTGLSAEGMKNLYFLRQLVKDYNYFSQN